MGEAILSLGAMFASLAFFVAGTSLLTTVLALQLAGEHLSTRSVGLVMVCYSIGFVIGSRFSTRLIRPVGQVRAFAAFGAIGCAASLIHPIWGNPWVWAVLRAIVGFCAAGLIMVLESWISARATVRTRGALLGIYLIVYFFAAAVGQYLVGFSGKHTADLFSVVAILLAFAIVPIVLTRTEAPPIQLGPRLDFIRLFRISPSGLMGGLVGGVIVSAFLSLGPLYQARTGHSVVDVSRYMAFAVLETMLLQWPVGHLSDLLNRRWMLVVISIVGGAGAAVAGLFGEISAISLYSGTAALFGLAGCLYPVSLALLNDHTETADPVGVSAGLLLVYGFGTCIGPLAGSEVMTIAGPPGLFFFSAGLFGFLAFFAALRGVSTAAVPVAEQTPYVTVPAVQAVAAVINLDPRLPPITSSPTDSETPSATGDIEHQELGR